MLLSELITKLEQLKDQSGDLPVYIEDGEWGDTNIKNVRAENWSGWDNLQMGFIDTDERIIRIS